MCDVVGGGYCEEAVVSLGKKLRRTSWIVSINRESQSACMLYTEQTPQQDQSEQTDSCGAGRYC